MRGVATSDLNGGESETLDLSDLAPGDYEVVCTIPGHVDSGMTGTLTITGGGEGAEESEEAAPSEGAAGAGHEGHAAGG